MTSMSDSSRVEIETLFDKLYSTRRETDFCTGAQIEGFLGPEIN